MPTAVVWIAVSHKRGRLVGFIGASMFFVAGFQGQLMHAGSRPRVPKIVLPAYFHW